MAVIVGMPSAAHAVTATSNYHYSGTGGARGQTYLSANDGDADVKVYVKDVKTDGGCAEVAVIWVVWNYSNGAMISKWSPYFRDCDGVNRSRWMEGPWLKDVVAIRLMVKVTTKSDAKYYCVVSRHSRFYSSCDDFV